MQLHLTFDDGSSIICSTQMYGGIWIFPEGQADNKNYTAAKEKPAILSDAFNRAYFETLLTEAKPNLSAKAFLATKQRIPGLGNGVLQDILYKSSLHPKTKIGSLSDSQRDKLFDCVKQTISEMAKSGGRDTEKDLFGHSGGYKTIMSSRNLMHPCPSCGGQITRQAYLGGNVYFCSNCQPLD